MSDDPTPKIQRSFTPGIPDGDDRERLICDHCGLVQYQNPKLVAGAVVRHDGKYLLCRRAIEPRIGFWTIPAGFLELGETPEDGARREAREEAEADLKLSGLIAIYTVRHISQILMFFQATLNSPHFAPGPESLDVALFSYEDIPWGEIAFPTASAALRHDRQLADSRGFAPDMRAF